MSTLNDWDIVDANNDDAPPDGWPESTMDYSDVNDAGRAVQGTLKRYFADVNGSLVAGGIADAYTVTLNETGYVAYFAGMYFACKVNATNTGASTMNVNAIGLKDIVDRAGNALDGGEIASGGLYAFRYDGTDIQLMGTANTVASGVAYIPAGTGAVTTTVQDKLREFVSAEDYGALNDGATDDTTALANAKTAAGVSSPVVYDLSGGNALSISQGTAADPQNSRQPVLFIEKQTDTDGAGTWDQGGIHAQVKKTGGSAPTAAITGSILKTGGGSGTGDAVGIHGRAQGQHTLVDGSVFGGWFVAKVSAAAAGTAGSVFGAEFNVTNNTGVDSGHWDSGAPLITAPFFSTVWCYPDDAPPGGHITSAVGIGAGSLGQFHTGLFIKQNAIVPNSSGSNEGIYIEGGSTNAKRYGGMRLGAGEFQYGINLKSATFQSSSAIQLGDNHDIQFGDANDARITFDGNQLAIGTANLGDPISFTINAVTNVQVNNTTTARNTRLRIWDVDNGQIETVSVGDADSGGTNFKLLRIPN